MPAVALDKKTQAEIAKRIAAGQSVSEVARALNVDRGTVRRYMGSAGGESSGMPAAKHEVAAPPTIGLPDAHPESYSPFTIDTPGRWLILNDIHVPYHDRVTLELAVTEAKRRGVVGVLLNGDTLDSHDVSNHDKDPSAPRYIEEVETCIKLLAWLRGQLPHARLVVKQGNHEERLERYVIQRAPALFGLEGIDLPSLLHFRDVGAEWVADRRVIALGKLCVVHGHEYRGGGGVSPARWLYLRAKYVAMCGHFHRTSENGERTVRGTEERAWSVGCACYLFPRYMPLNSWNHGFAFVEVAGDGQFKVDNRRVFGGEVV